MTLFTREPPKMSVSPDPLSINRKLYNITVDECFQSRNTVLHGQPFGGVPTVLLINIISWLVSPGAHARWPVW